MAAGARKHSSLDSLGKNPVTPVFVIQKPHFDGSAWVTGVTFHVRGQPVELVLRAPKELVDAALAWGQGLAQRGQQKLSALVGFSPDHFAGLAHLTARLAQHPALAEISGGPLQESVAHYHYVSATQDDPRTQDFLSSLAGLARSGDDSALDFLRRMDSAEAGWLLLQAAYAGDRDAHATIGGIQENAFAGDLDAFQQYMLLECLSQSQRPLRALYTHDASHSLATTTDVIAGSLAEQLDGGRRAQRAELLRRAMIRRMSHVYQGPILVRAPLRPLLFAA